MSDYLHENDRGGSHNVVSFHGDVSGNVAWASQTVTQVVTKTGLVGDELAVVVRAVGEAIALFGMSDEEATRLADDIEVIERELMAEQPDASVVRALVRRVVATLGNVANSSLALLLSAYAKDLLNKAGVPID